MPDKRMKDLRRFYSILNQLEKNIGGERKLADCHGHLEWPEKGVYFFKEPSEARADTGEGLRIVRVGTHAINASARTKLWTRLRNHKGTAKTGGGNHRISIFRRLVGTALIEKNGYKFPSWETKKNRPPGYRKNEQPLEIEVSAVIRNMPFLWLAIGDDAGIESLRGYIERNSIALLSNQNKPSIDSPSQNWLGLKCDSEKVIKSGLWNQDHVKGNYNQEFLGGLELLVSKVRKPT